MTTSTLPIELTLEANFPVLAALESPRVEKAFTMAKEAHRGQFRKYTGEPYIWHPMAVASDVVVAMQRAIDASLDANRGWEVETVASATFGTWTLEAVACAAILHDSVEDTHLTFADIQKQIGVDVAEGVFYLTDPVSKGQANRAFRTWASRTLISSAPYAIRGIKLYDMLSNIQSIAAHDPTFAATYLREKADMMLHLIDRDGVMDGVFGDVISDIWTIIDANVDTKEPK